jgi:hypothetical protein
MKKHKTDIKSYGCANLKDTFYIQLSISCNDCIVRFEIQIYLFLQALKEKIVFVVKGDFLQGG